MRACWSLLLLLIGTSVFAVEKVTLKRDDKTIEVTGRLETEAADGGVMLLAPDGVLWPITKEEIVTRTQIDEPFKPLGRDQLGKRLLEQLPRGFKLYSTQHYLIAYNTSQPYAQWVGSLYERLYTGFYTYWSHRKWDLKKPDYPLVAIVFDTQANYAAYARGEIGDATKSIIGYYSLRSNHVLQYDLTGTAGAGERNPVRINQLLQQPAAERTVATIVHEATHQLAFNSGMQTRFADIPFWVSEGLAVFFESPDLDNSKGWKTIGAVNRYNLINFRKYLRTREPDALASLLTDDKRFRDPATAPDAYAEAWALNYFLLKTRADDYTKYLKSLSELPPLVEADPEERLAMFRKVFGEDTRALEAEFLRYLRNVD